MIKTEEIEICGRGYRITQHGAKEGRRVLARVVSHLGDPLKATAGADGMGAFGAALGEFVKGLTEKEVDYFCDAFAKQTQVAWPEAPDGWMRLDHVFDAHFAGNYGEMVAWLVSSLEVNYASFFVEVRQRMQDALAKAQTNLIGSRFRPGATGASTVSPSPAATAAG